MNQLNSLLRHNLLAKILAFLVATFLWVFIINDQNPTVNNSLVIPVHVTNMPENYSVVNMDRTVKLKIRASRSLMSSYNIEDFYAFVDLSNIQEGNNQIKIQTRVPYGFEIVDMDDEFANVNVESIITRDVAVKINTEGDLDKNIILKDIVLDAEYVEVNGAKSLVNHVESVNGTIYLNGETEPFSTEVSLKPVDNHGNVVDNINLAKNCMAVNVNLEKELVKKTVSLHPIAINELPKNLFVDNIRVEPTNLEIMGEAADLDKIVSINTQPVDLSEITASKELNVKLDLPKGVSSDLESVRVVILVTKKDDSRVNFR